ncbi:MAG: DUF5906 domain-containing protein [Oscillospiraceae bacterium]|jgi:P4 family phage/plasmid primase-like protien|nr:DUF5906 domain-containing protein [Oscillospiraceae bacterium]
MNEAEEYINFRNGLLNINTMRLEPHTPQIFSTIQIPCDWKNEDIPTPVFDRFISTFTENNRQKAQLLLEYIGAVISNIYGYRFKKCMFLVGEGNSGKSLISALINRLIGTDNSSERSLKRMSERFGETAVYMKRFVYSGDLSFMKIDQMDRFKELTGGDTISVEYKNQEPFDYQFRGLMLFGMNALPKFGGDKGIHVYERMLILKCDNVIPKSQQDPYLINKLFDEREGIIRKCILSLRSVIENNFQFHIPDECKINIEEYQHDNSSVIEFWQECIEPCIDPETCINKSSEVYQTFQQWCKNNGLHFIPSSNEFATEISQLLKLKWKFEIVHKKKNGMYLKNYKLNENGLEIWRYL